MKDQRIKLICQGGIIAALYLALTLLANALGLANYAVQVRFSESLTILPYFTPAAVPGLFVGCQLSNTLTCCALPDIIFGSLATLIGAVSTYMLRNKSKWLAPLPAIVSNAIIVPFVLLYAYGIEPLWFSFVTVTLGELISCGVLGMLLLNALKKYDSVLFK